MKRALAVLRRGLGGVRWAANALATTVGGFFLGYPSLDQSRKEIFNGFRPRNATANQLLGPVQSTLTAQCRHVERFAPLARAAVEGLVAETIGTGITVLPASGDAELDGLLADAFDAWAEYACVDGSSLWCWQRTIPRDLAASGGALARWVSLPERAKEGRLPLAILPLESEWLAEYAVGPVPADHTFVKGIVADKLGRAAFFHLKNPDLMQADRGEIVPASEMIYVFEKRRAQQLHGEPLLVAVVERALQDGRLIETELKASVATAAPAVAIESAGGGFDNDDVDDDGEAVEDLPAGAVIRMRPGEKVAPIPNNRPTQAIAPFRELIVGDIAAVMRTSRKSLTKDYARSTFMNTRMEQNDLKKSGASLRETIGYGGAGRIYAKLVPWLLLQLGRAYPSDPAARVKIASYYLRPDGFEYVDPVKDVAGSTAAIESNQSTHELELSIRGKDYRQVFKQREVEQKMLDAAAVRRIVALQELIDKANEKLPNLNLHWSHIMASGGATSAPGAFLQGAAPQPGSLDEQAAGTEGEKPEEEEAPGAEDEPKAEGVAA